jgi:murein L,D-transpeptidase YafK
MKFASFHKLVVCSPVLVLACNALADDPAAMVVSAGRLPAYFIELPESVDDVLLADTGSATMRRYVRSGNSLVEKDRRYMSIGQNGAGKKREWDRKTPLGVYFITERLDTSKLHDKYGVAAFPLDYPNAWDRQMQRTGNGIWLHGVDHRNPDRPPLDTDGCLALPNDEILQLADVMRPLVTPVVVAREISWATPEELRATRLEFRLALDIWRESLAAGDLRTYLELYAEDFRYRDMDRNAWASYRLGVFEARRLTGATLDDITLLADPEEPNLYLSRFTQVLSTDAGQVTTTKRLYWRRGAGNRWEIVAEDSG